MIARCMSPILPCVSRGAAWMGAMRKAVLPQQGTVLLSLALLSCSSRGKFHFVPSSAGIWLWELAFRNRGWLAQIYKRVLGVSWAVVLEKCLGGVTSRSLAPLPLSGDALEICILLEDLDEEELYLLLRRLLRLDSDPKRRYPRGLP